MKKWPFLKSIFTFHPPPFLSKGGPDSSEPSELENPNFTDILSPSSPHLDSRIGKIWVDNTFRIWISLSTVFLCWLLSLVGRTVSFKAVLAIYGIYALVQIAATWYLLKTKYHRQIDFGLCSIDVIGISCGVYLTGGLSSPLYFLYFIPIIIQAFHRDWALIFYYGLGGVTFYTATLFFCLDVFQGPQLIDLGARAFFMLVAVAAGLLAVRLLSRQQTIEARNLSRMKQLSQISQILNRTTSLREVPETMRLISEILNKGCCPEIDGWIRVLLIDESGHTMKALTPSDHGRQDLKNELIPQSCPAIHDNQIFLVSNSEIDPGCPIERFSFLSHICVPIAGAGNEPYGVLFCGSNRSGVFRRNEREFLKFIGRAMGLTIQRLRRFEELQLSLEMDSCAMATYLASTKGVSETYHSILEGMKNILKTDQCSLFLWDPTTGELRVQEAHGPHAQREKEWTFRMGESVPGQAFEQSKMIWTTEHNSENQLKEDQFGFKSLICLPLQNLKGEPLGVINAWHLDSGDEISSCEIDIASTFITRATLAIENANLHIQKPIDPPEIQEQDKAA